VAVLACFVCHVSCLYDRPTQEWACCNVTVLL
jgi:hypothetical protein